MASSAMTAGGTQETPADDKGNAGDAVTYHGWKLLVI